MDKIGGVWRLDASSPEESRPSVWADGSFICWDGRLDNRSLLLSKTAVALDSSDAALVLELFRQKGAEGLGDAVGDWSLCIWDAPRRSMVLASDYAGIRPLYYCRTSEAVAWSSSLADVARWSGATLDDTYAACFLQRGNAIGRTPYAEISSVPPGHALCITRDRVEKRAFWTLPVNQEIRYRDGRNYEEQFFTLFREAVAVRVSADSPNCAELSGGLDSSSVVCMADRLRKEAGRDNHGLFTFSYTHDRCPDEKYFREVERACGIAGSHLEIGDYPPIAADLAGGAAPAWWEPRFRELARRMDALGSSVLLTGQLGDLITGNTPDDTDQVAEWMARGRFVRAARESYGWARSMQVPIYPILGRGLCAAFSSWTPASAAPGAIRGSTEDSLLPDVRERALAHEHRASSQGGWTGASPGRRRRFRAISEMLQGRTLRTPEPLQHLSFAHPFAHRPLVEFMLTIPADINCRPGEPRRLMRRAFANLLPPMVLNRKSKAAYTSTYVGALIPLAAAMVREPRKIQIVERGYADAASLLGRLEKFTQGLECNESQLRPMILFEYWLRNRENALRESPEHTPLSATASTVS
jgi:asparagine synthase (glutamine-hydrolysing)